MAKSKTIKKDSKVVSSRLQQMIDSMELVKMPVSELVPWEDNPRIHGDIDALIQSMSQFGVFSPILAQKGTNRILAGHRRYKAAVRDQLDVVPVILIEIDDLNAAGFTVADNAIAEQSKWDFGKMKGILDGLKIEGFDLSTAGFDDMKFEATFRPAIDIPVKRLPIAHDDADALRILIGDRGTQHLTDIDDRKLTDLLVQLGSKDEEALLGTGYDKSMVAALLMNTRSEREVKDPNAAAQWVGLPDYEPEPEIHKLMISFRSIEDKQTFIEKMGLSTEGRNRNTSTCWWPDKVREDAANVAWEG